VWYDDKGFREVMVVVRGMGTRKLMRGNERVVKGKEGYTFASIVLDDNAAGSDIAILRGIWDVEEGYAAGEVIADFEFRHLCWLFAAMVLCAGKQLMC